MVKQQQAVSGKSKNVERQRSAQSNGVTKKRSAPRRPPREAAISKAAVDRIAKVSRVKKKGDECHRLLAEEADRFLDFVIPCAIKITVHAGRKTISVQDVKTALEDFACIGPLYGYD